MKNDAISRSEVLEKIGKLPLDWEYGTAVSDCYKIVENVPALDVAPMVHAYWIGLEYDGYADGFPVFDTWQCSACGEEFYSEDEPPAYNFCTNCGARMDGEADV